MTWLSFDTYWIKVDVKDNGTKRLGCSLSVILGDWLHLHVKYYLADTLYEL